VSNYPLKIVEKCKLERLFTLPIDEIVTEPHAGFLSSPGSEFQTVGPAIVKGTRLFVPCTIRTMDFSFHPWIFRTIRITDFSYHPRTFRTVVGVLLLSIFLARDSSICA